MKNSNISPTRLKLSSKPIEKFFDNEKKKEKREKRTKRFFLNQFFKRRSNIAFFFFLVNPDKRLKNKLNRFSQFREREREKNLSRLLDRKNKNIDTHWGN